MNKLIKIILEAKFPQVDANKMLEIINATPNPVVATEIICNVYEAPVFDMESHSNKLRGMDDSSRLFISYDKWKEEVKYSYISQKTIYAFVRKNEDGVYIKEDIVKEYYDLTTLERERYNKEYHLCHVPISQREEETTCKVNEWPTAYRIEESV
jgi:hypothetical protein